MADAFEAWQRPHMRREKRKDCSPVCGDYARQAVVEFALILPLTLIITLGVIQAILIGAVAIALNEGAVSCARYAALNPSADQAAVTSYLKSVASPLINDANLGAATLVPTAVPRTTGTAITVRLSYQTAGKLFLGTSFMGINFPARLTASMTMTSE
jgi:hypothetical protein